MSVNPSSQLPSQVASPLQPLSLRTTPNPLEGSRDTGKGLLVSILPDICWTPVGGIMVPVPYIIHAYQADDANTTASVRQTSLRSHTAKSLITKCYGDEAGTGGGIFSGTTASICEPKTWSPTVRFEGHGVVRHTDLWWMNKRNTIGKLSYIEDVDVHQPATAHGLPPTPTEKEGVVSDAIPDPLRGVYAQNAAPNPQFAGSALPNSQVNPTPSPVNPPSPSVRPPVSPPGSNVIRGPWPTSIPPELTSPTAAARLGPLVGGITIIGGGLGLWSGNIIANNPDAFDTEDNPMLGAMMGDGAVLAAVAKMNRDRRDAEQEQPQAQPNVRTSQDPKRRLQYPCIVGTYSQIKSICSAAQCEGQAHHIIPDFTKRYGNREDGVAGRKRIPGMPTFNDGASICLNGMAAEEQSEHAEAHGADALIEGLGSGKSYYPAGTAPILLIAAEATNQLLMMKAGDIECIAKIRAAVAAELLPVNSNLLGRTTPDALPPIGSPQYDALSRGMTATRH